MHLSSQSVNLYVFKGSQAFCLGVFFMPEKGLRPHSDRRQILIDTPCGQNPTILPYLRPLKTRTVVHSADERP